MVSDLVAANMFFHATRRRYLDMYRLRHLHYYFLSNSRYHYSFVSITILNMAFLIVLILSTMLLYQSIYSPSNQDTNLKATHWALIIVYFFPVIGWLLICCCGITTTMVQDRMYYLLSRKCFRNVAISLCSSCPIFLGLTVMIIFAPFYSVYGVYHTPNTTRTIRCRSLLSMLWSLCTPQSTSSCSMNTDIIH